MLNNFLWLLNNCLTFRISNTFENVKTFDSKEIEEFHQNVGIKPLYRGKSITDPKEVIVIHQAEEE